jgi:energy-coupling factor transport system ATP-binding protein
VSLGAPAGLPDQQRPKLVADSLNVRYPGRRESALADISMTMPPGEILTVTGRTGAGKSTLALALAGFIPRVVRATIGGSLRLGDTALSSAEPGALAGRIGVVFSTPAHQLSASKRTVREELAFGLENLGVPRVEMDPRIDAVMEQLGIAALADREPLTLSGGEQQRVAIASIVVMGTDVIVLDEPAAQLDPGGTADVGVLLQRLAADGRVVVCAEQDAGILGLGRRCLLLDHGRPVALDLPGVTLAPGALAPYGLRAPALTVLAFAAGLSPADAFDEGRVTAALSAAAGAGRLATQVPTTTKALTIADLSPLREVEPASIELIGLVHRYPGGIDALRGVDLRIEPGEAVAIVGQNGSGKTTLVKHLNGLLRPDGGAVRVSGNDIRSRLVSDLARQVGFVFQNPDDQLFERSVEREIGFGAANMGVSDALRSRLVARAIEATGLGEQGSSNPYDLGPSERKLVALASVLAMDPAVLVLDEPTAGQDAPGEDRIEAIVRAWNQTGRSVVAITHDMEFAGRVFGRIVVMRQGQVVLDGTPAEVFAPRNEQLLASTGLRPPPAARVAAALDLQVVPMDAFELLAALRT